MEKIKNLLVRFRDPILSSVILNKPGELKSGSYCSFLRTFSKASLASV